MSDENDKLVRRERDDLTTLHPFSFKSILTFFKQPWTRLIVLRIDKVEEKSRLYKKLMNDWSEVVKQVVIGLPEDRQVCLLELRKLHGESLLLMGEASLVVGDSRLRKRLVYFTERLHTIKWCELSEAQKQVKIKKVRRRVERLADTMRADLEKSAAFGLRDLIKWGR